MNREHEFGKGRQIKAARPGFATRPGLVYSLFGLLCLTNAITLVGFLMAPDIAALLHNEDDLVLTAYESRINELRVEVDRLHSRQYAQAGDVNLQLQEIAQAQEVLSEQQQYVKALATKAAELGIAATPAAGEESDDALVTGSIAPASSDIATTGASVQKMLDETREALGSISEAANSKTEQILGELDRIGIRPSMPDEDAMGGPYLPAVGETTASGERQDEANAVYTALVRFKAARGAIDMAPIHRPLNGYRALSSSFGNRKDPFTGRLAFHSGLDFPAPTGTVVMAAAAGEVTFVGRKSGYGNVVEVTHSSGYMTRYGHLSAFLVKEGQKVGTGSPIAEVGSTGRSTGPHLHFEVRRTDTALDPNTFLGIGKRLQEFLQAS